MMHVLALPNWMGWIPILVLAFLVPFSFWVRWQVRKINREEGPVGLERQPQNKTDNDRAA